MYGLHGLPLHCVPAPCCPYAMLLFFIVCMNHQTPADLLRVVLQVKSRRVTEHTLQAERELKRTLKIPNINKYTRISDDVCVPVPCCAVLCCAVSRREYCQRVQDFLARRIRLAFLDVAAAEAAVNKVRPLAWTYLGGLAEVETWPAKVFFTTWPGPGGKTLPRERNCIT